MPLQITGRVASWMHYMNRRFIISRWKWKKDSKHTWNQVFAWVTCNSSANWNQSPQFTSFCQFLTVLSLQEAAEMNEGVNCCHLCREIFIFCLRYLSCIYVCLLCWQKAAGSHQGPEECRESSDESSFQEKISAAWGLCLEENNNIYPLVLCKLDSFPLIHGTVFF